MYPVAMASVLSGATTHQIRGWARGGILRPEETGPPASYSFRDVVALRTIARLRTDVSLQKIRVALGSLRELDLTEHVAGYTLVSDGSTVLLLHQDELYDLVKMRGQRVLVSLPDLFAPFTNRTGDEVVSLLHPRPNLEIRESRLGGWPTVSGSRVPFDVVADLVRDLSPSGVSAFYPGVSEAAARDALDFDTQVKAVAS